MIGELKIVPCYRASESYEEVTKKSFSRGMDSSARLGALCDLKGHNDKTAFDVLREYITLRFLKKCLCTVRHLFHM